MENSSAAGESHEDLRGNSEAREASRQGGFMWGADRLRAWLVSLYLLIKRELNAVRHFPALTFPGSIYSSIPALKAMSEPHLC